MLQTPSRGVGQARASAVVWLGFMLFHAAADASVGCLPSDEFDSHDFAGVVYDARPFESNQGVRHFRLEPVTGGWQIKVFTSSGAELAVKRVPVGTPGKNLTQITASDFLNESRTATVQGAVTRRFVFGRAATDPVMNPELIVPGERPNSGTNAVTVEPVEGDHGIGELFIEDIGLADIGPGKQPRLTYLKFRGCLGWHRGYTENNWRDHADPGVPDEAVSAMRRCGFDTGRYRLSDRMTGGGEKGSAAILEPRFSGDDVRALVVPARRIQDDEMGLAVCLRPDNRLVMAGFNTHPDLGEFVRAAEYWRLNRAPHKPGEEGFRPSGDTVVLGLNRGPGLEVYVESGGEVRLRRMGE